jgi:hypothetical protein
VAAARDMAASDVAVRRPQRDSTGVMMDKVRLA